MTDTVVRRLEGEEMLEVSYLLHNYAFHESPPLRDKDEWMALVRGRKEVTSFGLYENDIPVACVESAPMTQNVRGKIFPMAGIWGVATHPKARRKGYSRQVLKHVLESNRDDGRPLTCLYPFREGFYERMGYTTMPVALKVNFPPEVLRPLLDVDIDGEIELGLPSEVVDVYLDFVRGMQRIIHGLAIFDHINREDVEKDTFWVVQAKSGGELVGIMIYQIKGEFVTEFEMRVHRFYYKESLGRYLLLRWIAGHIDQVNKISMRLPSFERPETWLPDMHLEIDTEFRPPMGRVLDVAGISGIATGEGSLNAQITDPLCDWNNGEWRFESIDGYLQVSQVHSADCELNINALSALVYGSHDPGDFPIRGWGDPTPSMQDTMREMFPRQTPHLHEFF
jgi:predicted acetyltransferase